MLGTLGSNVLGICLIALIALITLLRWFQLRQDLPEGSLDPQVNPVS